jgi:hypothetical protein
MTRTLPDDIARCRGVGHPGEWREGCEDCQRLVVWPASHDGRWIEPPRIIVVECELRIPLEANR